ncbi:hypothetical protein [Ectobacillus ponti]|uniref:Uncharacterized protein n=1 Tax=Ectobacillus ponti TaxID=2961894 RepID=A0AA41XB24_9BACI|nr:hypothetical protein [Ectobacillus ponti]MCP8970054.1 hypothetical protein [Ectobacillus ponti]
MPADKKNHIHIPANPDRLKAKELKDKQKKRRDNVKTDKVTLELLYDVMLDIMDKQELLEKKLDQLAGKVE